MHHFHVCEPLRDRTRIQELMFPVKGLALCSNVYKAGLPKSYIQKKGTLFLMTPNLFAWPIKSHHPGLNGGGKQIG